MGLSSNDNSSFTAFWHFIQRLCRLYVSRASLDFAEKLARLFSGVALALIVLILGICVMAFLTLALSAVLTDLLPDYWSCLIIGGFFVIVILLLIALRGPILINPITRFVSRIIVESPLNNTPDDEQG